jgi:membrane-associated phospholipid phosphatase
MRVSEKVVAVYFAYTTVLALTLPLAPEIRTRTILCNIAVAAALTVAVRLDRALGREWTSILRDWLPLPLMLLAYKEMGWFAPPSHDYTLERQWIQLDRLLLGQFGGTQLIEFAGWMLPVILEASYVLVYALPSFTLSMMYVYHRRRQVDALLTIYLLGLYLSYAQFPYWPSEPPRAVFPDDNLPMMTVLRKFNLWILGGYGIHTSVFPSAHVSGAFAAALAVWRLFPDVRWLRWFTLIYSVLIAIATVYGRYHYAVDAFAGFVVGAVAFWIGACLLARSATPLPRSTSARAGG